MMVPPGFSRPRASPSPIMARATRSFTLPAGLKHSSLASRRASRLSARASRASSSRGVRPMS